jgi:cytolysin (calcineurin-like family phosphatase)
LQWLKEDLKKNASDGNPIIIFQHYGFDKSSLEWWSDEQRKALKDVISDYNVIAIFVGHNHFAENLEWEGIPVFQVNNAWKDADGNGSFAICQVTENTINVITCRWRDSEGNTEFVAPFYHGKINQK